jgi:hypothetical protein
MDKNYIMVMFTLLYQRIIFVTDCGINGLTFELLAFQSDKAQIKAAFKGRIISQGWGNLSCVSIGES